MSLDYRTVPAEVGGLYGINVETLAGDKTLTPGTDEIYQYFDEGGADRIITLATAGATAGDRFVIKHNGLVGDTHKLEIKQVLTIDTIYAGGIKEFIFDGTNWIGRGIGTRAHNIAIGEDANGCDYGVAVGQDTIGYNQSVAIGYLAEGYTKGIAVGYGAQGYTNAVSIGWGSLGHTSGVAVGFDARGYTSGVAVGHTAYAYSYGVAVGHSSNGRTYGVGIGYGADAQDYGVALGYQTDTNRKKYSIALGYYSECERYGETSTNINGDDTDQENNVVQGRWEGELAGGAGATEIFCAGQVNQRFTIRVNSVLAFKMTIVARDNVANEVAMYTVEDGLIKRDGAGNTVMVNCTVTVVHEDDAGWDCAITADDVNESLKVEVTGDGVNITQWAVSMSGVETHF